MIEAHIVGMYLPGLFSADLMAWTGPWLLMALGAPIITAGNAILFAGGTMQVRSHTRCAPALAVGLCWSSQHCTCCLQAAGSSSCEVPLPNVRHYAVLTWHTLLLQIFMPAMTLVGVGWNFAYVAASTLITGGRLSWPTVASLLCDVPCYCCCTAHGVAVAIQQVWCPAALLHQ